MSEWIKNDKHTHQNMHYSEILRHATMQMNLSHKRTEGLCNSIHEVPREAKNNRK